MAVVLVGACCLAACAPQKKNVAVWAEDKPQVMQSIQIMQQQEQQQLTDTEMLQARIDALEELVKTQQARIDRLNANLTALSARHPTRKPTRRAPPPPANITEPAPANPQTAQAAGVTPPATEKASSEDESNAYTAAYLALKSGRFDDASNAFYAFLRDYPQGIYADQAWYWLGESLYGQRKTSEAIDALQHLVNEYPESIKHAAALLKLGLIYRESGQPGKARASLERLVREYGQSPSAKQAREILKQMDAERNAARVAPAGGETQP